MPHFWTDLHFRVSSTAEEPSSHSEGGALNWTQILKAKNTVTEECAPSVSKHIGYVVIM